MASSTHAGTLGGQLTTEWDYDGQKWVHNLAAQQQSMTLTQAKEFMRLAAQQQPYPTPTTAAGTLVGQPWHAAPPYSGSTTSPPALPYVPNNANEIAVYYSVGWHVPEQGWVIDLPAMLATPATNGLAMRMLDKWVDKSLADRRMYSEALAKLEMVNLVDTVLSAINRNRVVIFIDQAGNLQISWT